ncbi:Uncharacterized protein MCB1EB_1424 [Mycoavidus cysteinexigens]|uniref:Uncharacterized protein n=1 Tax=Mycoavidus cysteinexigens TaxID=1553431 RepID=A0A2Z6EWW1_9BURK|nr:hypothetical protein [Mycoavidus cysteinexigens]BBE09585.1 Uncharacterized protein MCB1EB_1424 [Mycoavidus cysteinexigens]GAM51652.1 hypothetical protein EBME_0115 [bacterium endosymbiont of Mortierella elongata FMR23-6]GLR01033.1 hypothetical protein GCM10007934_08450 [Mycoavidus cysteinexigens]
MGAVAFDTLQFVETLKDAGVPEAQAKAFSIAVRNSHETAELATKADLREYESAIRNDLDKLETGLRHEVIGVRHEINDLRKDMDTKFVTLEQRMDNKLANMKFEIVKWMIGLAFAQTGLVFGLMKIFPLMAS